MLTILCRKMFYNPNGRQIIHQEATLYTHPFADQSPISSWEDWSATLPGHIKRLNNEYPAVI